MTITVFGSSRVPEGEPEYQIGLELGGALARSGFAVCTGGYGGTMEAVSRGAAQAGGHVMGVTARSFPSRANLWVAEEIVVETWRDRLFRLIELGNGYLALPGGTGSLAEIAVVWEMLNKRILAPRPLVLLGEFWKPVISLVAAVERQDSSWRESEGSVVQLAPDPVAACRLLEALLRSARPS